MVYSVVPILFIVLFLGYYLYLLLIKKDRKKSTSLLLPGLIFSAIWVLIYYSLLH